MSAKVEVKFRGKVVNFLFTAACLGCNFKGSRVEILDLCLTYFTFKFVKSVFFMTMNLSYNFVKLVETSELLLNFL